MVSAKNATVGQDFLLNWQFYKKTIARYKKTKDINKKNDSPIKKRKVLTYSLSVFRVFLYNCETKDFAYKNHLRKIGKYSDIEESVLQQREVS